MTNKIIKITQGSFSGEKILINQSDYDAYFINGVDCEVVVDDVVALNSELQMNSKMKNKLNEWLRKRF